MFSSRVAAVITLALCAFQINALPIKRGLDLANGLEDVIKGIPFLGAPLDEVNDIAGSVVDEILRRETPIIGTAEPSNDVVENLITGIEKLAGTARGLDLSENVVKLVDEIPVVNTVFDEVNGVVGKVVDEILRRDLNLATNLEHLLEDIPIVGPIFEDVNNVLGEVVDDILRRNEVVNDAITTVNGILETTINSTEGTISDLSGNNPVVNNVIASVNGVVVPTVNGVEGVIADVGTVIDEVTGQ